MTGAHVTGWGTSLPVGTLTNDELATGLGVTAEWIYQRTGIRTRHIAKDGETATELAVAAARAALARADVQPEHVDLVIVATVTPDLQLPATASLVQAKLGCTRAGAFDLNAGCAGFLYALAQGSASIHSGTSRRVLVCGVDVLSRVTDYADPGTCILFGDGAGAVVLEVTSEGGLGPFVLRSDGSQPELLQIPPAEGVIRMQGREVYRHAIEAMVASLTDALSAARLTIDDIALVVAHQANGRIVEAVADRMGVDRAKVALNIDVVGNTSAASIPLALADAAEHGRLQDGDLVAVTAFGAGFAWGAGVVRWGTRTETSAHTMSQIVELV